MPTLHTWIVLSGEHEAKVLVFCQSTSRVGAASRDEYIQLNSKIPNVSSKYCQSMTNVIRSLTVMERKLLFHLPSSTFPYNTQLKESNNHSSLKRNKVVWPFA